MDKYEALDWFLRRRTMALVDKCQEAENIAIDAIMNSMQEWIPVKDRLPDAAGVPVLVTAINTYGQKDVFEAFMGYGDFKWYTENVTRMSKKTDISCEVSEAWTITHWMVKPEPAEE